MDEDLRIDPAQETERIAAFIRSELGRAGFSKVVVGLSGGMDSAVVAFLCARAVGPDNVPAFALPSGASSPQSLADAEAVAGAAGISCEPIDITAAVDAIQHAARAKDRVQIGNIAARVRMTLLYSQSARLHALVAGASNRTEWMLGYTTLYGDSAAAFHPLLHLYKSQVRQLAEHLGVPRNIVGKPPSADLWHGQTDEGELGFTYDDADRLLFHMLDKGESGAELEAAGFAADLIARVKDRVARSEFKRRMPRSLLERP